MSAPGGLADTLAEVLDGFDLSRAGDVFDLRVGPVGVRVHCPEPQRSRLMAYFGEALSDSPGEIAVHLLPGQALARDPDWQDWAREPGKTGRKDAVHDLAGGGRLIRKLRSGVTFLQAPGVALAFGPLEGHDSTVINFINTQILSACQRAGWSLCHAAAVRRRGGPGLAIAGLSGGGKSTSILRMMDIDGVDFLSNDRVLVAPDAGAGTRMLGIPKHPRINPGTILGNPRLSGLLSPARAAELRALPKAELWALEDKHDLMIGGVYGPGRFVFAGGLNVFWVLNWSHDSADPTEVTEVDLAARPDLLRAIMKSPGPFYQRPDGSFEPSGALPDPAPYLTALDGVQVCEVSGRIDFDALAAAGQRLLHG
ncbi:MAG: HprK-related kinase B [Marinibacterium sp.]|nr:HprK-related kinase B [Marinibacterium sp.]